MMSQDSGDIIVHFSLFGSHQSALDPLDVLQKARANAITFLEPEKGVRY